MRLPKNVVWCGAIALTMLAPIATTGQGFPARPLELIVHTGAGAGNDQVARIVAEILMREKLIGQPVNVLNKVGGAGTVAFNYVKSRRGDPHTILSGVSNTLVGATLRAEFGISLEHFTPVALLARDPQAVIVSADSPYRTFKDLIDAAKREPGTLVGGIGSPASAGRILLWMMERETGTRFKVVSMKSGAEALISVMGGHLQLSTENISEGIAAIEAKKLRVLAVSSVQRMTVVPDAPTFRELGYDISVGSIRGFAMPAGVPADAVTKMETALERVYQSAPWKAHVQASYAENFWMGSAEFGQYLAQRRVELQEFLRAIGAMPKSP